MLEAYRRWAHLYSKDLQGELRSDKSCVFAPSFELSKDHLVEMGFPDDMKFSQDGTRVLGAPIGNDSFKTQFASDKVDAILRTWTHLLSCLPPKPNTSSSPNP